MSRTNGAPIAKWRVISPELAEKLLESQLTNRRLNERRVNTMAEDMKSGRWVENGETVKITSKGNLVDGQHRLSAIVRSGKPISTLVVENLPEKVMPTIDQGKARSNSDVLGLLGVNNSTHASGVTRALWELEKFGIFGARVYPPRSEIVKVYNAHADEIQDALLAAHPLHKVLRNRTSTAIAYILAARKNKKKADQFVAMITEGEHPIAKLLIGWVERNAHRTRAEKFVPILIKAWNGYVKGTTPQVLSFRVGESFPDVEG